ncbi:hypothetical protein BGW42_001837 [Actinomortierella wolfii]|nr:hypothetical protein BGW42_001837 [Actinomortierella wolfii]
MCQQHYRALIVWDIKTGQVILQDNDALPQIASFMWMNEQYIGYGATDGSVTIFDWSSRSELRVAGSYQEHTGDVIHVSMLGNQIVISASTSGEALLYSLPKRRLIGRFLLPGAAQSIQFTPTISGNKVMFSTREAVYEYELDIQELVSSFSQEVQREEDMEAQRRLTSKSSGPSVESALSPPSPSSSSSSSSSSPLSSSSSSSPLSASSLSSPCVSPRPTPQFHSSNILGAPNRNWKPSNSLLSQIRQKIGHGRLVALSIDDGPQSPSSWTGSSSSAASSPSLASSTTTTTKTTPATTPSSAIATGPSTTTTTMARTIPTRFPQLKSVYCIRPGSRILDHGTTSARCSYGVFMRQGCATLSDVSVYSRATKRLQTWRGAAVDRMLRDARRSNYYTTMECNEHCAVITSGDRIYVVSFLPHGV